MAILEIPEPVRLRAVSEGAVGEAWLAALPGAVAELAADWGLTVEFVSPGGTQALVVMVAAADGRPAVLKVDRPGRDPQSGELNALLAGEGRGYARVYAHDAARGAMLLERLGGRLADLGWSADDQMTAICATLKTAWRAPPDGALFMDGAQKARGLAEFVEGLWKAHGAPGGARVRDMALRCAASRAAAFDPGRAVLGHGDAHAWNTLQVPGTAGFKFVDPDGLFIEPAYDVGLLMREWPEAMLADPVGLARARRDRLAALSGLDPQAIWEWGALETVSTALHCLQIGLPWADDLLAVAEAWAAEPAL